VSNEVKMKKSNIHKQIQENMLLYLDGDLEEAEAKKVQSHVAICPHCSRMLEDYRQLWKDPSLEQISVPSQRLWNNIWARICERGKSGLFLWKLGQLARTYAFPVFMAVMISLAAAAGAFIGLSGGRLPDQSSAWLGPSSTMAEELKLGLFDIAPTGSLTEIFSSLVTPGSE